MQGIDFCFGWEIKVIEFLQSLGCGFLTYLSKALAFLGDEYAVILFVGLFYWGIDKKFAKRMGMGFAFAIMLNPFLKNLLFRRRPYFDHKSIKCISPAYKGDAYSIAVQGYSFPSLHATVSVSSYGSLVTYGKKALYAVAIVLPFIIGISRMYMGVHYPTDILAGWIIGALAVWIGCFLDKVFENKLFAYLIIIAIFIPGWFFCKSEDFYTDFGVMTGLFAAFAFEGKAVNFENTKNVLRIILRLLFGVVVFVVINAVIKMILPGSITEGTGVAAHIARALRYAVAVFACMGVYPMIFKKTAKFFKK